MARLYVYMREYLNQSSMTPLPVVEFKLPRAAWICLQMIAVDLGNDKNPISLVDCEIEFTVRRRRYPVSDEDILFIKTIEDGITIDPENDGYFDITIPSEDLDIIAGTYWYDLKIVTADGEILRQPMGRFTLLV